jgi:RNA polymerase-binding transcription factor DksA
MPGEKVDSEQLVAAYGKFARALEEEQARLSAEIDALATAGEQLAVGQADEGRAGSADADVASDLAEAELDLGLERAQLVRLTQVEAALRRLQADTYGRCTRCDRPIEIERLNRLPWVEQCSSCAASAAR